MSDDVAVRLGITYIALHCAAYFVVGRRRRGLQNERTIFTYHVVSYLVVATYLSFYVWKNGWSSLAVASLIVMTHGAYSLSFLELWSLSQGGYTLSILRHLVETHERGTV